MSHFTECVKKGVTGLARLVEIIPVAVMVEYYPPLVARLRRGPSTRRYGLRHCCHHLARGDDRRLALHQMASRSTRWGISSRPAAPNSARRCRLDASSVRLDVAALVVHVSLNNTAITGATLQASMVGQQFI